ncbi:MAG: phosphate ABC transporter substrate-binding protein PstS [Terriglobales bacterium]
MRGNYLQVGAIATGMFIAMMFNLGCNKSSTNETASSGGTTQVIGAGSTFIYPIMSKWINDFQGTHPGIQINYQSIGSGGGIQQLKKGLVDFGASDASLSDDQLKDMKAIIQIPESAGPVCITYNLPDLKKPLQLSASTLAGIYLGKIKTWQDLAVRKDNPGVTLPKQPVVVAHRSDGSGTSNIFTTYLAKVSPEWSSKVGKGISVSWPVGLGGKGSEGVTGVVKQTPGTIGYVELNYAKENNLPVALIRNQAGNWEAPSPEGTAAAISGFSDELAKDVRTPIVDPPASAKDGYPICGFTYLLVPKDGTDAAKRGVVKSFIQYILTDGQANANALFYAKLPATVADQDQKLLGDMLANGQPIAGSGTTSASK